MAKILNTFKEKSMLAKNSLFAGNVIIKFT